MSEVMPNTAGTATRFQEWSKTTGNGYGRREMRITTRCLLWQRVSGGRDVGGVELNLEDPPLRVRPHLRVAPEGSCRVVASFHARRADAHLLIGARLDAHCLLRIPARDHHRIVAEPPRARCTMK